MQEYLVTWRIDIEASSPEAAAEKAREIQMDKDNVATYYTVQVTSNMRDSVTVNIGEDG